MTDIETMQASARTIAEEASKPGKFNFLDRVTGRNYPTDEVEVYLDEAAGHRMERLRDQIISTPTANEEGVKLRLELEEQLEIERAAAAASRYVFHIEGIPVDEYDAVVIEAQKLYPLEYIESRNPLTMALERQPKESEDREQYFRVHIWAKYIRKIVDPDGNFDDNITPETVAVMQNHMPLVGIARVQLAIERLRMVSDWMDQIQGEDFLAKS